MVIKVIPPNRTNLSPICRFSIKRITEFDKPILFNVSRRFFLVFFNIDRCCLSVDNTVEPVVIISSTWRLKPPSLLCSWSKYSWTPRSICVSLFCERNSAFVVKRLVSNSSRSRCSRSRCNLRWCNVRNELNRCLWSYLLYVYQQQNQS